MSGMRLAVDNGQCLGAARDQVKRLKELSKSRQRCDLEVTEAKRLEREGHEAVARATELWADKEVEMVRDHELARVDDASRIAGYELKLSDGARRIKSLEAQLEAAERAASAEDLPAFLARLGLEVHLATLTEEELDMDLLRSMDRELLANNMGDLGLSAADITRIADDLFS